MSSTINTMNLLDRTKISVVCYFNGKPTYIPQKTEKRILVRQARLRKQKEGTLYRLCVTYKKNVKNEGTYSSYLEFRDALDAFTEPELLEYIYGGSW